MLDINNEEEQNAIRMSWNILPANAVDQQRYIIPCGIHYTPLKQIESMKLLDYEPVRCRNCKSVLAPSYQIDFRSKAWICPFCNNKNMFPKEYSQHITPENLPMELLQTSSTIIFLWDWNAELFDHFEYLLRKTDWTPTIIKQGTGDINKKSFALNLHHGNYEFIVKIISTSNTTLATQNRSFYILDDLDLILNISSDDASIPASWTI